jgi:hypothetical protein
MRYEVYGIYNNNGVNYEVGVARSLKGALEISKQVSHNCKHFAILVKSRKYSYPDEILSGLRGGPLTRATMLMSPNKYGNPIQNETDGKNYWGEK